MRGSEHLLLKVKGDDKVVRVISQIFNLELTEINIDNDGEPSQASALNVEAPGNGPKLAHIKATESPEAGQRTLDVQSVLEEDDTDSQLASKDKEDGELCLPKVETSPEKSSPQEDSPEKSVSETDPYNQ